MGRWVYLISWDGLRAEWTPRPKKQRSPILGSLNDCPGCVAPIGKEALRLQVLVGDWRFAWVAEVCFEHERTQLN